MEGEFEFRGILCRKEEADTHCWGFAKNGGPLTEFEFKLPPLGKNELRTKITNIGLSHRDFMMGNEWWGPPKIYPLIPGQEICGIVEKMGDDVKGFKIGDKVLFGSNRQCCYQCERCLSGCTNCCSGVTYKNTCDPYLGGYSTYLHAPADFHFHLNPQLDARSAAPLMGAGIAVFAPLLEWCVQPGVCGVVGLGGLGHLAIQYAKKMGMKVVCISSNPEKELEAKELGASEFVCSKKEEEMKRLGKEGCDLICNTTFAHDISPYITLLKSKGTIIQLGSPHFKSPLKLNYLDLVVTQKNLVGAATGSLNQIRQMLDFSAFHHIQPIVENYSSDHFAKAYEKVTKGKPKYRCVVDLDACPQ